jgi:PPK2 family polyphosphate:nucleotide phosphotransferase
LRRYQVKPGTRVRLDDWDPDDIKAFRGSKKDAEQRLEQLRLRLEELQELLYAQHEHKLLIVLQGMDTSGKDGTIRHVFEGVNPQGVSVARFGPPTQEELDHDYLWRVHRHTPAKCEMMIFNRSHYEDVLVVRVHGLVPKPVWKRRYQEINDFERMLVEEGVTLLKFFLHISRAEQRQRLQQRLEDPTKHWKFSLADEKERKLWPEYRRAYEDALERTSTEWAPWHIVPANHKWYRNLVVATIITNTLRDLRMRYPKPSPAVEQMLKTGLE